ncbi:MAG: hypothetical protein ABIH76_04785 [Candidatus Bathyarchaeota archaeon]
MVDEKINGDPSAPEEQTVPKGRFDEVYKKHKETEEELQTLKAEKGETLTPEQQKERQAKTFLKGLVKEQLEEEAKERKAAETQEQKEFESNVDDVLAVNTTIDRQVFLKFIEDNSDKYGITTVTGAMKLYKDLNKIKDETVEQTKENLAAKPKLPKSAGVGDTTPDYSGDKKKSYEQVTSEIIEEAEAKGRK